ncbi:MAG TPA: YciI family protein [Microlunatus sp.]|nr:YciI family protein [Microlunatus sp.]
MTKYLLIMTFDGGQVDQPMDQWRPDEVDAHLDYYRRLNELLTASGELITHEVLAAPDVSKVVVSDGAAPVVTDGPFTEFKEWVAGYQLIDVDSEERALEIAALVSAAPGPGGRPTRSPIQVRRVMEQTPTAGAELSEWLGEALGQRPRS